LPGQVIHRVETKKGKNHSLNASNLREEINCFERTGLNSPCPNIDLLPFIESKAIEGERKLTYWCMPVVLNSLFFLFLSFLLLGFLFLLFYFLSFSILISRLCFSLEVPITVIFLNPFSVHNKGSFIMPVMIGIYYFSL